MRLEKVFGVPDFSPAWAERTTFDVDKEGSELRERAENGMLPIPPYPGLKFDLLFKIWSHQAKFQLNPKRKLRFMDFMTVKGLGWLTLGGVVSFSFFHVDHLFHIEHLSWNGTPGSPPPFQGPVAGAPGPQPTETVFPVADLSRDREKKVLELVENHCRFTNIGNVEGQMACFGDRIFKYFDKGQVGKSFIMKDIKNHTRPYEIFATDLLDVKANKAEGNNLFDYEAVAKIRLTLKKRAGQVRTQIITNFYGLKFQGDKPEIVYIDRIKE